MKLIILKKFRINPNFQKTANGKPYIKCVKNFHFSISHSNNLIIFAIDSQEIGVDAEKIIPLQTEPVDFFSQTQLDVFNHLSKSNKLIYFYQLWSLKESFIKLLIDKINLNLIDSYTFLYKDYVISVVYRH